MAEASNERPAPSATGVLSARPVLHLLVYARNRRLTGALKLDAPDGRSGTIDLWRGRISNVRTTPPVAYFGALAYELGLIDTTTLDATLLEIANTKRLHGEVLIARGALTPKQRDVLLCEQACRKIHHLSAFPPESTFAFYEGRASGDQPPLALDPIKPAWRALREARPSDGIREVLARYTSITLRLANEGPVERAGFDAEELALCDALTWKPMNLAQLRATSQLPAARVDLLVYLLVITKCAEPAEPPVAASSGSHPAAAAAAPSVSGSMPKVSVPPPSQPRKAASPSGEVRHSLSFRIPSSPAIRTPGSAPRMSAVAPVFSPADLGPAGIAHRAQQIRNEDPCTALGLPEGASVEAARAAYFRLSKLWHPDRLPADLAAFRDEVATVFAHLTSAHRTLTEVDARREHLERKVGGVSTSGPLSARSRAEAVRGIDQALAKRELEAARIAARELAEAAPDDADAQAIAAWASTLAGEAPEETLRAAVTQLDRVVQTDRHCERAHFYRGLLHKRLGSSSLAFRDFSRVVQLNPKHVDAQREVRIFEMRARKGSGEHALDALMSKVKKK